MSVCLSICLSVCLTVRLSVHLSVHLSVRLYVDSQEAIGNVENGRNSLKSFKIVDSHCHEDTSMLCGDAS